jgi:RNA polymerase sigma-70 factor (ECF subfamily)
MHTMDSASDRSLEELLAHAGWVRGLAAALVGDPAAADDLAQDTWLAALRNPPSSASAPRPWLARIATNLARNRHRTDERRRARELHVARPEAVPSSDETSADLEMHRALVEALMQIEEPLRGTIVRRYLRGWSAAEIARAESITESAVRHRLKRGLEMLRDKLDRKYGERGAWCSVLTPMIGSHALSSTEAMTGASASIASTAMLAGVIAMSTGVKVTVAAVVVTVAALWMWRGRKPIESSSQNTTTAVDPSSSTLASPNAIAAAEPMSSTAIDREPVPTVRTATLLDVLVIDKKTHDPMTGVRVCAVYAIGKSPPNDSAGSSTGDLGSERPSDAAGHAVLELPPGCDLLVFAKDERVAWGGIAVDVAALAANEHRSVTIELTLSEIVPFFGRVLARDDRRPLADAIALVQGMPQWTVEALRERPHARAPIAAELTSNEIERANADANGNFELRTWDWKQQRLHVRISAPSYAPAIAALGRHTTPSDVLEILLDRSAAIDARVIDANDRPIESAWVDLRGPPDSMVRAQDASETRGRNLPRAEWSAKTGADGTCTFVDFPPNVAMHGTVSRDGWAAETAIESFTLAPGERRKMEWKLVASCTLSGRVTNEDGTPAAGVNLWLKRAFGTIADPFQAGEQSTASGTARTDESGHYRIDSVSPGRWRLGPAATRSMRDPPSAGALAPFTEFVDVPSGVASVTHDLVVHPGLYIRGSIVDPAGRPLDGGVTAALTVVLPNWHIVGSLNADPGGAFVAGPLLPGKYLLRASCQNYAFSEHVAAEAGATNVVLKLHESSTLAGTVVDAATHAPIAARVVARQVCEDWDLLRMDRDDDPTAFRFEGLRPGNYELVAHTDDGHIGVTTGVEVRDGETIDRLFVSVEPAAKLRLHYAGAAPYAHYRLWMGSTVLTSGYAQRNVDGVELVPLGNVKLEVDLTDSGRTISREVDVFDLGEKTIVFDDEN